MKHPSLDVHRIPRILVDEAATRYAEPHRAYHGVRHLHDVLDRFAEVDAAGLWEHPREACLALLFHDAIYEPGATDNEERSAVLASGLCRAHLPDVDAERVAALIRLTAMHGHQPTTLESDEALVLDCDLAVLGAAPAAFDAYDREIRLEFAAIPDDLFRAGRRRFLSSLLASERLFASHYFTARLDARARTNLRRALERSDGSGAGHA